MGCVDARFAILSVSLRPMYHYPITAAFPAPSVGHRNCARRSSNRPAPVRLGLLQMIKYHYLRLIHCIYLHCLLLFLFLKSVCTLMHVGKITTKNNEPPSDSEGICIIPEN